MGQAIVASRYLHNRSRDKAEAEAEAEHGAGAEQWAGSNLMGAKMRDSEFLLCVQ